MTAEAEPLPLTATLPVVEGRLYVGFARVATMPNGRIGMSHLMRSKFDKMGEEELKELVVESLDNLMSGLNFKGFRDDELGTLVSVERDGPGAFGVILLNDFHEKAAAQVGADRLVVGLVSPDHVYFAAAGSGQAEQIREAVLGSPDTSSELVPCLLHLDAEGIEIIAERSR
ncbi:hypothetical protein [Nocardia panacis]|uniref:hypothetical protein n=1 Tax=Nocardia panacis TaxID=2340916 RepID=UPI0011C4584A|nr:hypothetical protein [Nocardia panacis]